MGYVFASVYRLVCVSVELFGRPRLEPLAVYATYLKVTKGCGMLKSGRIDFA